MKKQLKKTVSLGLAAVMALGLTACGGGSSSSDSTTAAAGSGENKETHHIAVYLPRRKEL